MITFVKKGGNYSCVIGGKSFGYLNKEQDGFYYFFPNHEVGKFYPALLLKEVAFKLEALNEAETQRQLGEAIED